MLEVPVLNIPENLSARERDFIQEVLQDYWICCVSREASLLARKEVLTGKAKFGIIGDGKEVPQVALARAFKKGDFRSGYYRDQTFMFALGLSTLEEFFAQLYADHDNDPFSGGRQMNNHFATPLIEADGTWTAHRNRYNVSADISSTGGQMARGLGLALASRKYRESHELRDSTEFSHNGNEVSIVTIGDASTSEGVFWETMNAAAVMRVPLGVCVWDDGFGISVPIDFQTVKKNISTALEGFRLDENGDGIEIYVAKAWDYPTLCTLFERGIEQMRQTHIPALFHITEVTQPQGHSTSGSHERYKSKERLQFEIDKDCNRVMRQWIIDSALASDTELTEIEAKAKLYARDARRRAWDAFIQPVKAQQNTLTTLLTALGQPSFATELAAHTEPNLSDLVAVARRAMHQIDRENHNTEAAKTLRNWLEQTYQIAQKRYAKHLHSENENAALRATVVPPQYAQDAPNKPGYEILNAFFDAKFGEDPTLFAFGEDVGQIGDVNQGFMGLQKKYGIERVFDTGIREWTIMGQAIGMAMRGLRPIAEIQYLDYLIYGLEPLSDDLATLRWRSNGQQAAPAIIRTRGHRLEGVFHAGSPMAMLLGTIRGIYLCTPRNMTQAVGMYNTLLQSDDPAIVVECLNGYRLREPMPTNLTQFSVPLGIPDILIQGTDVTLVTYGSCIRIAEDACKQLQNKGISVELIDAQTLLPFDTEGIIGLSLRKTNRLVVLDEDLPGGASAFMLREILEIQKGYQYLDATPRTITAAEHRPPYGSDGDYFSKPNAEDIFEQIYALMQESQPNKFTANFAWK